MIHASLFSGIGGFDLAAEWMGWENLFHCEWNPFGQQVLKHHFPNSISYNDITKTDFSIHNGQVDILTGGFPCQPYSSAGKRLGKADERHLFPHMLRCIKEVKPRWIIGENVRGLVNWNGGMVFNEVCDDLEREGYEVQSFLIPAASVNAPHQRYRIWFVAYSKYDGGQKHARSVEEKTTKNATKGGEFTTWVNNYGKKWDVTDSDIAGIHKQHVATKSNEKTKFSRLSFKRRDFTAFPTKPPICGGDDGIPRELDNITFSKWRNESIKAYGNAIVPQVAHQIFKAIQEFELMVNK
jgi:DNA (cytosine-5)-methyltransferase 1